MSPRRRERKNPELEKKLLEYRAWARTYGGYHATSTIPKQVRTIRRYGEICNMLDPLNSNEIVLDELVRESERGVKPQSLNHIEYDLEAWSRFLGHTIHLPRFKQSPSAEPWIPTDDDVMAIRKAASSFPDRAIRSRNSCIIDLLFAGGMRIGELIRINLEDLEGNLLNVRSEKNERPRIIGLPDSLTERINEYIANYRSSTDPVALFTTEVGRLNYGWARNLVKKIAIKAGVPKFHAHAARHWCATALLRRDSNGAGLDIREIQIHLGHASLASTQVYTHLTGREVAKHTSEKMGEFFRMKSIKNESTNPNGTAPALYGTVEI
ncbi:MAG: tyrosine-type recombinase/integrase [Thermoplasmataceae archaeon]